MKLFVADTLGKKDKFGEADYHWCDDGDILMFGQFQTEEGRPTEVSMCGLKSRCFTTHILVKELDITKEFFLELLSDSVEKAMKCKIDRNGDYNVTVGFEFNFNINDIANELIEKASHFEDGQKVRCYGRNLIVNG